MDSNLFWCIIGIIGGAFFSLLISLFFYLIGLKRKCISYYIKTFCIISDKVNQITDLEITYHDNKLEDLYSSTIIIKNTGNSIIEYQDFIISDTPSLCTDGEFIINDTFNSDSTILNEKNNLKIIYKNDININQLNLNFDYIAKKEKIVLSFFHTGNIYFNGKLKDGKIIQIPEETKYEELTSKSIDIFSYSFDVLMVILIIFDFYNYNIITAIFLIIVFLYIKSTDIITYFIDQKRK